MKNAFLLLFVAPLLLAAAGPPAPVTSGARAPLPAASPAEAPALDIDALLQELLAGPPPGYYDNVDDSTPETLRATLHETIDDHTWFPYSASSTDTWDILESADEDPSNSNNILDLYKNLSLAKFGGGTGPYNREHVWPNSYGFPDRGDDNYPYSDCHHLFLCDVSYNGDRANTVFRDCPGTCIERPTVFNDGQGGGSGVYPGNANWYSGAGTSGSWETWIGRRGDVARAILYMDVRYEGGTHGVTGFAEPDLIVTDNESLIASSATGSNAAVAYMGMRSVLLEWHLADPPDDKERRRNDVIYSYQGNRNPFIDHPEWFAPIVVPVKQAGVGGLKARFRR